MSSDMMPEVTSSQLSASMGAAMQRPAAESTTTRKVQSGAEAAPDASQKLAPVSRDDLAAAVADVETLVQMAHRNLNFSIDDESGSTIVKVIDSDNDEIIRQFPSEEMLAIRQHLSQVVNEATGILLKEQA